VQEYQDADYNCWSGAVAVDSEGSLLVSALLSDTSGDGSSNHCLTLKYDQEGNLLWDRLFAGTPDQELSTCGYIIELDADDNAYVAGSTDNFNFTLTGMLFIKYDPDGNEVWAKTYEEGDGYGGIGEMRVDPSGNIYAAGAECRTRTDCDFYTTKLSTDGEQLWVQRYSSPFEDSSKAYHMEVDSQWNVYVTGNATIEQEDATALVTIKYNSDGNELWVNEYIGDYDQFSIPNDLVVDSEGSAYVSVSARNLGSDTCVLVKLNTEGAIEWLSTLPEEYSRLVCGFSDLKIDSQDNIFLGSQIRTDDALLDYQGILIKYSTCYSCQIDDFAYCDQDTAPTNQCLICDVSRSNSKWSLNDEALCDDGLFCNGEDFCREDSCIPSSISPCDEDQDCDEENDWCSDPDESGSGESGSDEEETRTPEQGGGGCCGC
jgi:hypothetical protein